LRNGEKKKGNQGKFEWREKRGAESCIQPIECGRRKPPHYYAEKERGHDLSLGGKREVNLTSKRRKGTLSSFNDEKKVRWAGKKRKKRNFWGGGTSNAYCLKKKGRGQAKRRGGKGGGKGEGRLNNVSCKKGRFNLSLMRIGGGDAEIARARGEASSLVFF